MDKVIKKNNKGVTHFLNKNIEEAEKEYLNALNLDNKNTTAHNNLGLLYHQKKNYLKAEEHFKKALQIKEKDTYFLNLANTQVFLNKQVEAEKNYNKSIRLNPDNTNAQISLARFYEFQNKIVNASTIWLKLVNRFSDDFYKVQLAKNYMALQSFEEALSLMQHCVSVNESSIMNSYIGVCEFNLKNYGLAELAFKKSLGIEPDNTTTRHYLAINFLSKGDYTSALRELDFILKMVPENEKVSMDKASVLLNLQKYNEAKEIIEQVLLLNADNKKALQYKKMLLELKGNKTANFYGGKNKK